MRGWLEQHLYLVVAGICLVIALGLVVDNVGSEGPRPIVFREGSGLAPGTPIRVQVAGAVVSPGVYELREGDRVVEALTAAGGPTDVADLEAVNLARRVRDEEQVLVPARTVARSPVATLAPGTKLDINTATEAQLDLLPGIGEAYSRRIVDSRKVDGPYKSTQELVERRVLPAAVFEQVRELVSVGP